MSLNTDFRNACIENNYFISNFSGKEYNNFNDLQICHILSKSKRTLNSIKKMYGCSEKTADLIMNMPLLNTVVGSRQDNAEYKKTDDINYIDCNLIVIVNNIINTNEEIRKKWDELNNIHIFHLFRLSIQGLSNHNIHMNWNNERDIKNNTDTIKDIQYQFHKEIDLHI